MQKTHARRGLLFEKSVNRQIGRKTPRIWWGEIGINRNPEKRHNLEKGYAFFMDLAIRCNLFRYSGFEYAEPYVHRFALFCKR